MATLTKRDRELFHALGKYGLLTTSQVEKRIFPGVQSSTVLRRLRALVEENWIYRIKALESGELVWILSRQGESEMEIDTPMIRPNRNGVAHDVQITELRMRLEAIGLAQNFIPEWVIRRATYHHNRRRGDTSAIVPDGIFSAVAGDGSVLTVALELELSVKNLARYEKIFKTYMDQDHLDFVWYFVPTESFGRSLLAKWEEAQRHHYRKFEKLVFTVIPDFERDPRQSRIYLSDGRDVRLGRLFKLSAVVPPSAQAVGSLIVPETPSPELKSAS